MADSVILPCPHCGTLNRVPGARLQDVPVCSDCRDRLLPGRPVELDEASFERFVGRSELPVVVDFWASWCGPCRQMAPHFDAAAGQLATRVRFAKLDTEAHAGVAQRFGIQGIPTLILFRGGREIGRQSGALSTEQIVGWVTARR